MFVRLTMRSLFQNIITKLEWEKRLKDVKVSKEDMNRLVMNFLVTEGYGKAAQAFQIESGAECILLEYFVSLLTCFIICLFVSQILGTASRNICP